MHSTNELVLFNMSTKSLGTILSCSIRALSLKFIHLELSVI